MTAFGRSVVRSFCSFVRSFVVRLFVGWFLVCCVVVRRRLVGRSSVTRGSYTLFVYCTPRGVVRAGGSVVSAVVVLIDVGCCCCQ